jgi:N-acetylmuramoyl-L-alanine amidase
MFKIDSKHRLTSGGKLVDRVMSPFTGGKFSPIPAVTVIHFTFGGSARSSADWFSNPDNKHKSSAHVVIGRDGGVIQCVDFDTAANHAGKSFWRGRSGLNSWSFGIELANWGNLKQSAGSWVSWTGQSVPNAILAVHKNGNPENIAGAIGWEPYPAVQIEVAAEIVRLLVEAYGPQEIIGHDDISVGRKWDPGPAFDMARFREFAFEDMSDSGSGLLKVFTPGDTLNLRGGPGTEFPVEKELDNGTLLEPLEFRGPWVMVNVLAANLAATKTGWVNSRHTIRA